MAKDVTVWLQTLGGTWEACGTGQAVTVPPESVVLSSDEWGPATATFDLKRAPSVPWPDLTAFTPVDIWIGGLLCWSGRIKETPTRDGRDRAISVHCEGWQNHLDDDLYEHTYVTDKLSDWKDARSVATAPLAFYTTAWQVNSQQGSIVIGLPDGSGAPASGCAGVVLDLGTADAKRLVLVYESGGPSGVEITARGANTPLGAGEVFTIDAPPLAVGPSQQGVTFTTSRRYLEIRVQSTGGALVGADNMWVRLTALRVFSDASYEGSGVSVLPASTVVVDALDRGTVLLSDDRSGITATGYPVATYATAGPQTARKSWQDVNAYHNWVCKIDVDRRPIFKPKPAVALLEIGPWAGSEFADASANSGEDIYNRGIVTGQTPDGSILRADRTSTGTVVSAQGFTRAKELQAAGALPSDLVAANLLDDIWLSGKATTPFRGTVTVTGDGVRDILNGTPVEPERLLAVTGDMLRFSDRVDPDTGAFGRDGRIVGVTYTAATEEAQIEIDSSPKSFEALLARLAVVTGNT